MAKKKVEIEQKIHPGWSEANFNNLIAARYAESSSNGRYEYLTYHNKEYVPMYNLAMPIEGLSNFYSNIAVHDGYPVGLHSGYPKTDPVLKNMWRTKRYARVIMSLRHAVNGREDLKRLAPQLWEYYMTINANDSSIIIPGYRRLPSTSVGVIKHGMHGGFWGSSIVADKDGSKATQYLSNKYFLAAIKDAAIPADLRSFIGSSAGREVVPLYSVMVKKENANLVRAHILNDKEMDSSYFELWVDKTLDEAGNTHPIREQFMRLVRNPLIKAGVEHKVFENLRSEMYLGQGLPSFKSIKEKNDYVNDVIGKTLREIRRARGIKERAPALTEQDFENLFQTL